MAKVRVDLDFSNPNGDVSAERPSLCNELFGEPALPKRKRRRKTHYNAFAPDRDPLCRYEGGRTECVCTAYTDGHIALLDVRTFRQHRRVNVVADVFVGAVTIHNLTCDGRAVGWPRPDGTPAASVPCHKIRLKVERELLRLTRQIQRDADGEE